MGKYINPFTDFGFKKIFGEEASKKSLISFLNDILPIEYRVKEITFQPSEQLGTMEEMRTAIYDIYCRDEKGGEFIVEMQNARQTYFKDRAVFYSTFPIQRQAEKGNWNFKLRHVFCIGILGFEMPGENEEYIHRVHLKDQKNNIFYEKLTFIFAELPKFKKEIYELETHLEKWFYFLKNLDGFDDIPEIFKEEVFIEALEKAEKAKMSIEESEKYERNLKYFRDNINIIDTAIEEGREIGKEEGRKEGLLEGKEEGLKEGKEEGIKEGVKTGKIEMAIEMLKDGEVIEKIIKYTKLTKEEIELLR